MDEDAPPTVRDVMSTPIETISRRATIEEAANLMTDHGISALFVPGSSAGVITSTDVVEAVARGGEVGEIEVSEVMTTPVERITTEEQLAEAAAMMMNFGIKHLPVIDTDGDYVGMVSTTDVTAHLA